jgi:hypothetical protein
MKLYLYGLFFFASLSYAAPAPVFNLNYCIQASIKDCIQAACIEHAPTDCRTQCKTYANDKCRAVQAQQWLGMDFSGAQHKA